MRRMVVGMSVAVLLAAQSLAAQVADRSASGLGEWLSGNVAVTSDYAFRGISQTLEEPAIQGGMDLVHPSGLYLGTCCSSVNFGEPDLTLGSRAQMELDVYGGLRRSLRGVADLDLGAIHYAYPGAADGRSYNFVEMGLGASRSRGGASVGLQARYSPDFFAGSGAGVYFGASLGVPVSLLTVSGKYMSTSVSTAECFGGTKLCGERTVFSIARAL